MGGIAGDNGTLSGATFAHISHQTIDVALAGANSAFLQHGPGTLYSLLEFTRLEESLVSCHSSSAFFLFLTTSTPVGESKLPRLPAFLAPFFGFLGSLCL
jgi:hypothetical protein